ncbi:MULTISPECIES: SDR family NAD(P)-dependent oxidoreductase [unclassified Curtobacterium]|uniref:SDR family NAD(P)-dependent oxidoreductase n=1 Tax=unclassified Curtobacterium TaxID=257496 RepID=UPI00226B0F7E|nr:MULTISPECIES: SDR family NAD(P)-dependent oxidoreductase [unclassified Curtobacterium]
MARILVTGSTDGLGRATAETLLRQGHDVIVHARSHRRAEAVSDLTRLGADLVVADFADRDEVLAAAQRMQAEPPVDGVVHNAGVISGAAVIPVNVVAPYLLTAVLTSASRHVYLSSSMHRGGRARVAGVDWSGGSASSSYSDSKLLVTALAAAVATRWPSVQANAVDPGWVPTKMGGAGAPDDLELGHRTQERLIGDPDTMVSGGYWFHDRQQDPHPSVRDPQFQDELLLALGAATGVAFPGR